MKFCLVDQELGLNIFRKVLENILPFVIKHLASMLVLDKDLAVIATMF